MNKRPPISKKWARAAGVESEVAESLINELWEKIYVAAITSGKDHAAAMKIADTGCLAYLERF